MSKLKVLALLLSALLGGVVVGWAINEYIIESNRVTVTVTDYEITLEVNATSCLVNEVLNFTGTFTKNTAPQSGQTIMLVCDDVPTGDSASTDANGFYQILYTVTQTGSFEFYTNTTVTIP